MPRLRVAPVVPFLCPCGKGAWLPHTHAHHAHLVRHCDRVEEDERAAQREKVGGALGPGRSSLVPARRRLHPLPHPRLQPLHASEERAHPLGQQRSQSGRELVGGEVGLLVGRGGPGLGLGLGRCGTRGGTPGGGGKARVVVRVRVRARWDARWDFWWGGEGRLTCPPTIGPIAATRALPVRGPARGCIQHRTPQYSIQSNKTQYNASQYNAPQYNPTRALPLRPAVGCSIHCSTRCSTRQTRSAAAENWAGPKSGVSIRRRPVRRSA